MVERNNGKNDGEKYIILDQEVHKICEVISEVCAKIEEMEAQNKIREMYERGKCHRDRQKTSS